MIRYLILFWLLTSTAHASNQAYIKLQLDSSEVFSGDTIVLDVESTGLLDPIDFSVLEQSVTLIRETTGTRIAVIGGKVQEIAIRRMDLQPNRSGVLVIGPLIAGDVVSNSVHIKVLNDRRPEWTPQADDVQIKTSLSPANAMVNQQVLFTVELWHRYPISSETITLPDLQGFSTRALVENRRTFATDQKEWFRTEWQTLIYPRQSGAVTIDAIEWSGTLTRSNIERAEFTQRTEPLTLNVNSAPAEFSGWWLPGRAVTLTESWSAPPTELRAGDELERTITVTASDVLSGQLPTPDFPESRALKQVLIDTRREETIANNTVRARADFTYRVTAQSPIPVFLDTVRLPWWDTEQRAAREAIVPARRINVGLPDRADVLSKLALEESRGSQIKHWLQSADTVRLASYVAAVLATIGLLWMALQGPARRWRRHRKLHRHINVLRRLARHNHTTALYQLLQSTASKQLLQGAEHSLVSKLEAQLFCSTAPTDRHNHPPLSDWLTPVVKQALHQHYNLRPRTVDTLAKL